MADLNSTNNTIDIFDGSGKRKIKNDTNKTKRITIAKKGKVVVEGEFASYADVPWVLPSKDDPGIFIHYGSDEDIHAALSNPAVLPPDLLQGTTAEISRASLKNWVRAQMNVVVPGCQVPFPCGVFSDVAFHHITFIQFMNILNRLNHFAWSAWCQANGKSAGQLFTVTNVGLGANEATSARVGPFV